MTSPYECLPGRQFWKLAIEGKDPNSISSLYKKKFSIDGLKIATAGSCFAQEIAKGLRKNGYDVIDSEPAPESYLLRGKVANSFGYGLYSARHGNIYTARQLFQLAREALGDSPLDPALYVWTKGGRYYDALRPNVEPEGLSSPDEVVLQRLDHLRRFRRVLKECGLFVFTLGLTEAWMHDVSGLVYPTAPGVVAGDFDPDVYSFKNFRFFEIYEDFLAFRELVLAVNSSAKFLITVSPVPLTATYCDAHVLSATVRSKSILRAVAAELYEQFEDIDYFPSFEMFSTPFLGSALFKENRRSVHPSGVAAVMEVFFSEHIPNSGAELTASPISDGKKQNQNASSAPQEGEDPICEDALLEAFAGGKKQ